MEQHNIDSRFKKGLENLNRQPSADAWARLQSQLNAPVASPEPEAEKPEEKEEKRILMWWHYAAAAVVLLFISVGIIKNAINTGGKTEMPVAVNQKVKSPEQTKKPAEVTTPVAEDKVPVNEAIAKVETPETKPENQSKNGSKNEVKTALTETSETQLAQVSKKVKTEKLNVTPSTPENLKPESVKIDQPAENLIAAHQPEKTAKPEITETKTSGLTGMAIEVIVKKDRSAMENAVAVNEPVEKDGKDSKLKTIFKQARNLKNGETVNLQELGLSADSKLALGTRKLTKVLDI